MQNDLIQRNKKHLDMLDYIIPKVMYTQPITADYIVRLQQLREDLAQDMAVERDRCTRPLRPPFQCRCLARPLSIFTQQELFSPPTGYIPTTTKLTLPVTLGQYAMGYEKIEVVAEDMFGGSFSLLPADSCCPRIKVGLKYDKFIHVLGTLTHEAMELALVRLRARFEPSCDVTGDASSYIFNFNHVTLSEAAYMAAELVESCKDELKTVWERSRP